MAEPETYYTKAIPGYFVLSLDRQSLSGSPLQNPIIARNRRFTGQPPRHRTCHLNPVRGAATSLVGSRIAPLTDCMNIRFSAARRSGTVGVGSGRWLNELPTDSGFVYESK